MKHSGCKLASVAGCEANQYKALTAKQWILRAVGNHARKDSELERTRAQSCSRTVVLGVGQKIVCGTGENRGQVTSKEA